MFYYLFRDCILRIGSRNICWYPNISFFAISLWKIQFLLTNCFAIPMPSYWLHHMTLCSIGPYNTTIPAEIYDPFTEQAEVRRKLEKVYNTFWLFQSTTKIGHIDMRSWNFSGYLYFPSVVHLQICAQRVCCIRQMPFIYSLL